jgi:hypothetical protein
MSARRPPRATAAAARTRTTAPRLLETAIEQLGAAMAG